MARKLEWVELEWVELENWWPKAEAMATETDHKLQWMRPTLEMQTRFWQLVRSLECLVL